MKRQKVEIAAAVLRLAVEQLIPIETAAKEMRISRYSVRRWISRGRNGVFLDGVERNEGQWFTSRNALARFQEQWAKRERELKAKGGAA